jgi:hypothetical protein
VFEGVLVSCFCFYLELVVRAARVVFREFTALVLANGFVFCFGAVAGTGVVSAVFDF